MKKYLILIFVALAAVFQSCDNNDDLWDAIDDLKSRVQALETQVDALNGNIEALQKLYGGATISKVENVGGKYVVTLTNGETIELVQGSEAEAVIPIVSINDKGEWQVSTDNGATFTSLGVKAVAEDGTTPRFRIDEATDYWQVSYDGGMSFENVKDTKGQPVKAIGSGTVTDKFFEEVKVDGSDLYIKLLGGEELRIPIVSDFFCRIITPTEGVQTFDAGATKRFVVEIRGVEQVKLSAPEGWTARLTDAVDERAELIVTAPAAVTRATADTSKDVAIEAFAAGGLSTVAKIQVESTGTAPAAPTVAVTNSATVEPTQSALTFDVAPSANADGWKYLCLKSTEVAPDADKVLADGTAGAGTSVTVENLEANTAYTIYVVAYAGDLTSEVASVGNTTAAEVIDQNDYYKSGVEIDGVRYDQNSEGAQLLEVAADAAADVDLPVSQGGIYFIDDKSNAYVAGTANSQGVSKDLVIIGRYADAKTEIKMGKYWALRNPSGLLAFKNLKINMVGIGNYAFNATDQGSDIGGMGTLVFEDCEIAFDKTLLTMYNAATTASVGNIVFRNCKLRFEGTATSCVFITTQKVDAGLSGFKRLVFENNIIYSITAGASSSPTAFSFLTQDNAATNTLTGSLSNLAITFKNNTLVDIISFGSSAGSGYFYVGKIGSVDFSKNLLYSNRTDKYVAVMRVQYDYNANGPWPSINLNRTENKVYGTSGWKLYYDGSGAFTPGGTNTYPKLTESPLTTCDVVNGKFVVADSYAGYGSTLE